MKYSKEDVLQMLISQYHFQTEFDPAVVKGMELNYESSISEWIDACDLINPKELAKYYYSTFEIKQPISELENILLNEDKNTLSVFCEYISQYAERQNIESIKLLGQNCQTASIFKTLKQNLTESGADTTDLKPSTKINEFFLKSNGLLFHEVNRIAPGTMSEFEYKANKIQRIGSTIGFFAVVFAIGFWSIWFFHWLLLLPIVIGIVIYQIGVKKEPEKMNIGGFDNFRELIYEMEKQMKKAST
ncbi:hypothetical protein FBALC1_07973 [Flavobacteriales bacterium ALC-1]|nr:hypothetical protein FBALC1_07973 [Flavobacteriales bacterium ALC-1]